MPSHPEGSFSALSYGLASLFSDPSGKPYHEQPELLRLPDLHITQTTACKVSATPSIKAVDVAGEYKRSAVAFKLINPFTAKHDYDRL